MKNMNKINVKILALSFIVGFLFLGLTDSLKNYDNMPNQSAAAILAQVDEDGNLGPRADTNTSDTDTGFYYNSDTGEMGNTNTDASIDDYITGGVDETDPYNYIPVEDVVESQGGTMNTASSDGEGIVACDGACKEGDTNCVPCDINTFGLTIRNLISKVIQIGLILAALIFAYAGWLFMTARGSQDRITKAKGIFWKVLIGVVLAMSAFLIVEIILDSLGVTDGIGGFVDDFIG